MLLKKFENEGIFDHRSIIYHLSDTPHRTGNCLVWGFLSCGPTTIDQQGHRIFNPNYLFYLETERHDKWQKPAEVLKALEISNTAVVADIGAGGGYFTEKFSKYLSPSGHVMPPMFKM